MLYESTGLNGQSRLRKVDLETGEVLQVQPLDAGVFRRRHRGLGDRIDQLTWKNGIGFVYDRETFEHLRTFTYTGEGWGLTTMASG